VAAAEWTLLDAAGTGAAGRPSARYGHSMVALSGTRVLMFGGQTMSTSSGWRESDGFSDELWSLDVAAAEWTLLDAAGSGAAGRPSARAFHNMVALSGTRVQVFGGETGVQRPPFTFSWTDELWSLDVNAARWTLLNSINVTADELWEQFNRAQV